MYSRHADDAEVKPVPGIPEEGEGPHTEAPGQDLDSGLERVDACEHVPEQGGERERERETVIDGESARMR